MNKNHSLIPKHLPSSEGPGVGNLPSATKILSQNQISSTLGTLDTQNTP